MALDSTNFKNHLQQAFQLDFQGRILQGGKGKIQDGLRPPLELCTYQTNRKTNFLESKFDYYNYYFANILKARGGGGVNTIFSVFTYVTELLKTNK